MSRLHLAQIKFPMVLPRQDHVQTHNIKYITNSTSLHAFFVYLEHIWGEKENVSIQVLL